MDPGTGLTQLCGHYEVEADSEEALRLREYLALLRKWNRRVNLTASTDWPALASQFEEALWAARFYPRDPRRHLDIGSGAGFPAVPLRILRPSMQLSMLESRARKAAFLETVAAELGLAGTAVVCRRAEEYLESGAEGGWDTVSWKGIRLSSRALKALIASSAADTRFWMFHGPGLPLQDPAKGAESLRLVHQETFPARPAWHLSVFGPG